MRKHEAAEEEKSYVNASGLCVRGASIKLSNPVNKRYSSTNKTIDFAALNADGGAAEASEFPTQSEHRATRASGSRRSDRPALKVNVHGCENFQACGAQLKRIHETVRVGDFERILKELCGCDANKSPNDSELMDRIDDVLDEIDLDGIYEEFFGQHYDALCSYSYS